MAPVCNIVNVLCGLILVFIVRNVCGNGGNEESWVVNIKQGSIRGYKAPEGEFFAFYGVPYATAPTGPQRFQAPLPPPIMPETFEAVNKNIVCPQFNYYGLILNENMQQTENCLVANIYVPQTDNKNLPVLVYIHGGAFNIGFSNFLTPTHLAMMKKAIIVNFNYRIGAHGFLSLGTKDVPGNAGMKDQVALLKWVKENIAGFGGNPGDVTIAGYSAGSSSVGLLMLSKMANGLFKKVIPESGANIASFSIQKDPTENAKRFAKQLNFNNVDDITALEEFYKTVPYDLLTSINVLEAVDGSMTFSPCVERDTGTEKFLDDSPITILKSGNYEKLPILYGLSKHEGLVRLISFETWKEKMNAKFSDFLPSDLQFQSEDEKEGIANKVKNFYFGNKLVDWDTIMGYIDYITDTSFAYSILVSVRLQIEAGNKQIYVYEYDYTDENSPLIPYTGIRGADHCAQSMAVHDGLNMTHKDESNASDDYKNMKQLIREMWLNFVITGQPVPEGSTLPAWPPTGANASPYMVLNQVPELQETPLLETRIRFWDEIYSKHYRHPIPPRIPRMPNTEL